MSFALVAWAMEQETGSPTRKWVLVALANVANHHSGECRPSYERLAEETELGVSTIKRAVKELSDAGFVKRQRRRRGDGSLGVYEFEFPEAARARSPGVRESASPGVRETPHEPGEDLEPERGSPHPSASPQESETPSAPKLTKIDGRDIAFDALARACGIGEQSPRLKDVGMALSGDRRTTGIRDQFMLEQRAHGGFGPLFDGGPIFERELAAAIPQRAQMYRAAMSGATLTPRALAKWWTDLPTMAAESGLDLRSFHEHATAAVDAAAERRRHAG